VAAFSVALASLLLVAAGVAVDGWMTLQPLHVRAACSDSANNITYITPTGSYCEGPNPAIRPWLGVLIAVLGLGLLFVAWKLDRRSDALPRQGWKAFRAWAAPLLWLAAIPAVSVLLGYFVLAAVVNRQSCQMTYEFIGSTAICPVSALIPAVLVPGLLYLVPLRWLWTTNPRRRIAAITASILGVGSVTAWFWALFSQGPTIEIDSGILPPVLPPGAAGLAIGAVSWLLTLIALLAIAKLQVPGANRDAPMSSALAADSTSAVRRRT